MAEHVHIRERFDAALAGEEIDWPVYAVYDWFVLHRDIDWPSLMARGLGKINHANLYDVSRPHLEIRETTTPTERGPRRDVWWITDRGELHEWYLGEWRQEYFIKTPDDYRIMQRAIEDATFTANARYFEAAEAEVGQQGITVGQMWRTPLMEMQIDRAGLARFSMDLADQQPELMDLLDLMGVQILDAARQAVRTPARYIKLWENLSLETIGTGVYRRHLVPQYHKVLEIFHAAGKRLLMHYDGRLRLIAQDIAGLDFGIDSLTPPPEGDMSVAESRAAWPDKFLWLHPPLGWYETPPAELQRRIREMVRDAGPRQFCLMISEDVPPHWAQNVPLVLDCLKGETQ
jgi:hypothetical protein